MFEKSFLAALFGRDSLVALTESQCRQTFQQGTNQTSLQSLFLHGGDALESMTQLHIFLPSPLL